MLALAVVGVGKNKGIVLDMHKSRTLAHNLELEIVESLYYMYMYRIIRFQ